MNPTQLRLCIEAGSINDFYQINSELEKMKESDRDFGSRAGRALLNTIRERFATLHSSEDSLIDFYILTNDASFINTNLFDWRRVHIEHCCALLTSNKFREEAERQLHKFLLDFLKKPPCRPEISVVVRELGDHGSLGTNDLLVLLIDTWRSQRARLAQPSVKPQNHEEMERLSEYIGFNLAIEATEKAMEKLSTRSISRLPKIGRPRRELAEALKNLAVAEAYVKYCARTSKPTSRDFARKLSHDFVREFIGVSESKPADAWHLLAKDQYGSLRRWALDLDVSELSRDFVRSQFTGGEEMSDEDADRFIQYVRTVHDEREQKKASKGDSAR